MIDIDKISKIARITLSEKEKENFSKDLEDVLLWLKDLDKIKVTKDIEPTFQPIETKNVTREDIVEPSLEQELALSNTENKENGYFKGPQSM
ncbi:MAG: Asp-tRNA(Asn)/Glu-tRNA(Gln) amidotransferase subunit GatC [DPANN group archaeon]|nr:Asp-tRNA(Asn)/Glu-tRNA(Gln) amidotransferase subunit GatC [DPANN group archaeon]